MEEITVTPEEIIENAPQPPEEMPMPSPEDMLESGDDIGFTKEEVAALAEPIAKGQYIAKFSTLKKNIFKDAVTGEEKFLGYVHPTKKAGKKVMPTFILISDDPIVNNRPISAHVSTTMRLFAQLDKQLDLLTGTRIDSAKVEGAKDKVVILSIGLEPESKDINTGKTYPAKNSILAILPYKG